MLFLPAFITSLVAAILYKPISTKSVLTNGLENVLLVTAHPDDECMFFAPTILGLHAANVTVSILSLSRGNADGLGEAREAEYMQSLDVLSIPESRRFIIEHPDLQDDITKLWDPDVISDVLHPYIVAQNISTILTFDPQGVSGHPNHGSAFLGARHYARSHDSRVKVYSLISVPLPTKYLGIVAPLQAKIDLYGIALLELAEYAYASVLYMAGRSSHAPFLKSAVSARTMPVFVSGFDNFLIAHRAMRQHWSQLVWYRWLYVLSSRYMWVNEWQVAVTAQS
ncbi:LmbE-like protein [Cylindrobasidium torrendii FP15055 ss-10]|uniref:N-acetylglucosaminylphosphatidylinositol deacetylase n=1 Tax=Cylindrobasidium torrendii FP15055 ss-10 TaxID=1314674 RepID=A0A0D7BQB9_9AGAR|nr:LmbE-like protein [Cylindrobasidium torrendii FP15055 ss-10]